MKTTFAINITIKKAPVTVTTLRTLVKKILQSEHVKKHFINDSQVELSVVLGRDPLLHSLNKEYRGKDKPTDVLSFSAFEGEELVLPHRVLGDLVISYDRVLVQAKKYKHSPRRELTRLLVHGILHLLGFDHEKVPASVAARMRRTERAIMKRV